MRAKLFVISGLVAGLAGGLAASASAQALDSSLSFFITSANAGKGANLGGLTGADAHCQKLAAAAGSTKTQWRAYLSTQAAAGTAAISAKNRIGIGPWFNAKKVQVASSVADLHSANNKLGKEGSLTETGAVVNGRGDTPNRHDILTGSNLDGTAFTVTADRTCANWTSETTGGAQVGHHDKQGGGDNPTSWNSAHTTSGCSITTLRGSGGEAYFYCFAADAQGSTGLQDRKLGMESKVVIGSGNRGATFRFRLESAQDVEVQVVDAKGTQVATLASGRRESGSYEIAWDGKDGNGSTLPPGAYLMRLLSRPLP